MALPSENWVTFAPVCQKLKKWRGGEVAMRDCYFLGDGVGRNSFQQNFFDSGFKDQSNEIFCLWFFFRKGLLQSHFLSIWRLFEFDFEFKEIFAIYDCLSATFFSGEPILSILFNTQSATPRIIYSGELQMYELCDEPCQLIRRVETPCNV
jgi:hypothetical protein